MFDMQYSGKAIAKARKAKNMTQMELADAMNISYQAVSNWERGVSMPDISKLPELSEILGISIDDILGKNSAVIKNLLINGDFNDATVEELVEAVPLLKPSQIEKVVGEMGKKIDWTDIFEVLEYLSEDFCAELFRRAVEDGEDEAIKKLLEYVDEDVVDEMAQKRYEQGGVSVIWEWRDYISEDAWTELAKDIYQKEGIPGIRQVADYIDEDVLNEIAADALRQGGMKAVKAIADYIDYEEVLEKYIREKYL